MILSPQLIKQHLKKLGIRPDKYLGQHFLIDTTVLKEIVTKAQEIIRPHDTLLEVGPGLGALTQELINLSRPVIAVEQDPVLASGLSAYLGSPSQLSVIKGDVLKELVTNQTILELKEWCVIANIPYAITSPLLRKLLYRTNSPHHILILVQHELAQRVTAPAGSSKRGLLTLEIELVAQAHIVRSIDKDAFWPSPKVESALLLIERRETALVDPKMLARLLQTASAGFSAKRKQLHNSLAGGLNLPHEKVKVILDHVGIMPSRRAETLTVDEWKKLTEELAYDV